MNIGEFAEQLSREIEAGTFDPEIAIAIPLNMCDEEIQDVSPLRHLTQLRRLDLDGTAVTDFSSLECLPNLKTMGLYQEQLGDGVSALKLAIPDLHVEVMDQEEEDQNS